MSATPIIVWFRQDLRLEDHPALDAAVREDLPILALYIHDEDRPGRWKAGGASRWWLHHALEDLDAQLAERGNRLVIRRGRAEDVIEDLVASLAARGVYASRCYEPWARAQERTLADTLAKTGRRLRLFDGVLLHDPEALRTKTGAPYQVFTPFWKALRSGLVPPARLPAPRVLQSPARRAASEPLAALSLLPDAPDWAGGLRESWQPGEAAAQGRLEAFAAGPIGAYKVDRDRPAVEGTSRLSPYLHFGQISPAACWRRASWGLGAQPSEGTETFLKELAWREFSYHLLYHFPDLPDQPFRREFAGFPWREDARALRAWQRGRTGYPLVDAGMRELWQTGWMHNRVRMVVASFLVKHLLVPWQHGEAWFWDTLVDADLASNAASWQWVAGSGADAAPYFRIFNPVKQGETFDPQGRYVRRWVPEIALLPDKNIHAPWEAPQGILEMAGIRLGREYPLPIVDHAFARNRALEAFAAVKKNERQSSGSQ